MFTQPILKTGLKEWSTVCQALGRGRQILLLRKGGIHEAGGEFEIETPEFVLFPTFLHQDARMLKAEEQGGLSPQTSEPASVRIEWAAAVTDIYRLKSRRQMDLLDDQHIWSPPLIDMRFNYRPENPLYLLLLRVYRLAEPREIANSLDYCGCKSWVPLKEEFASGGVSPVMTDEDYAQRQGDIRRQLEQANG